MPIVSYGICAMAGIILFGIGLIGLSGLPAAPSPSVTLLLEPLGDSRLLNIAYWEALMVLGVWLTLYFWVRVPAGIALCLVVGKIAVVKGWMSLEVGMGLCMTVTMLILGAEVFFLYQDYSNK